MDFFIQTIFNFIIYSFFGWIIENVYCYTTEGRFLNDTFLYGPFKLMYGFAGALLLTFLEIYDNKIFIGMLCIVIPTLVEYCSGYIFKKWFDKIYWDYSNFKYNIQGYICLQFSIYWMMLSFIGIYYVQPLIDSLFFRYSAVFLIMAPIIVICLLLDAVISAVTKSKKPLFNLISKKAKI